MKTKIKKHYPLIGSPDNKLSIILGGYLLNLELVSVDYKPTVSDDVIIKCKAINIKK